MKKVRLITSAVATAALVSLALTGCGEEVNSDWKTVTSVKDGGGMNALVAAAKKEGKLNVIALPHTWANYGEIIEGFKKKYPEIQIEEQNPDGSSQDEITAAKTNAGNELAPDVFDLGLNIAVDNKAMLAPYKVQSWDKIPAANKEETGLYVSDYTGVMTVGWNKTKLGDIDVNKLADSLTKPEFKSTVALKGKPAEAGAAFAGFLAINLSQGGTMDKQDAGLSFFKKLKEAGTLTTVKVTDATIDNGETNVVFDWTYNQVSTQKRLKDKNIEWAVKTLPKGEVVSYYNQAINKEAPHPAAARLWQEYLYSPEAQNLWLKGGAYPILLSSMEKEGTVDKAIYEKTPKLTSSITYTDAEAKTIKEWLKANWDNAVG